MTQINWLHLTDLHIGGREQRDDRLHDHRCMDDQRDEREIGMDVHAARAARAAGRGDLRMCCTRSWPPEKVRPGRRGGEAEMAVGERGGDAPA